MVDQLIVCTWPHQRLIAKTRAHGITGNVLGWIKDFLSNKTQCVVVKGVQSEQFSFLNKNT